LKENVLIPPEKRKKREVEPYDLTKGRRMPFKRTPHRPKGIAKKGIAR